MRTLFVVSLLIGTALFAEASVIEKNIVNVGPYGSWESPITAEMIAKGGTKIGSVGVVDGSIYLSEMRPNEKGRTALAILDHGKMEELLPLEYNARTTVHEYGGGSVVIEGKTIFFSNFSDQQLYKRDPKGKITQLTHEKNTRFADGTYDASRKLLFYVLEIQGEQIENCLGTVDIATGNLRRIAEGSDFYASPRLSRDGQKLAYYCWENPNMPWDGGELRIADLNKDGTLGKTRVVAGSDKESICQFTWGPDGSFYFVSDRSGWWNLYREKAGKIEALCPMDAEFGEPQWTFGQTTFAFWGTDKIVCTFTQNGFDFLGSIPLGGGKMKSIEVPYTSIRGVSVDGDQLYFVGSSGVTPSEAVQYNLKTGKIDVLKKSREVNIDSAYFSLPRSIEYPTEGNTTAHAFYYAPVNPKFKAPVGELPPLLVLSHGGPTSQAKTSFNPEIQYWTSRGMGVIDVNYGGSSGYGRAYRDRLIDNWGIVDVDDCVNAALYCSKKGLADKARLAIAGGSAGGFTTLAALAFRDVFSVGASLFGVSDLEALANHTHKFEARYLDSLVGPYPARKDLYEQRSPINYVDQIKSPIILLQGDEDAIVPPAQSELMYKSLLKRGVPTAYVLFAKEQHGFRQAANIIRAIEAESYFFSQILGFTLADKIEPVQIENAENIKRLDKP